MKRTSPFILLLWMAAAIWVQSCNENNCPLTTVSVAHFDFLDSETHSSVSLSPAFDVTGYVTADVTVHDTLEDGTVRDLVVKDSVLTDTIYTNASTSMSLPLSYASKTTYVLHYTETMTDVIEVTHRNIPYLENIECGTMMFYEVEGVTYTTNHLDSVVIINPSITNEETRNFVIYYRISDDTE